MSKYFMKNNEKKCDESPPITKNESRLLAPTTKTTTTAVSKSPFSTS